MALITVTGEAIVLQPSSMCASRASTAFDPPGATPMAVDCPTATVCSDPGVPRSDAIICRTANSSSSGYVSEQESVHPHSYDSCEILKHFNWDLTIDDSECGGSMSVDEQSIEAQATALQRYPAVFRWTGAGQDVSLAGTFNSWRNKIPLVLSHGEFYTVVDVAEGTHQYKYFVDGDWVCHPNEPKIDNGIGTQNNVVTIKSEDCDIYRVLESDSLGTLNPDPTSSPPGSYSQYIPAKDASFGFHRLGPPLLPPHLLDTVLNKEVPVNCEPMMVPEPNHVVLNHLFTLSIKGDIMVLGTTHRYRKKYITTLLYKPI